jgi:hypothetical protein
VKALQGLLRTKLCTAKPQGELPVITAGDLVLDEKRRELPIRGLLVYGLAVSDLQGVQDFREAKLLEKGCDLSHGVHGVTSLLSEANSGCAW